MPASPPVEPPSGPRSVERPADAGRTLLGIYGQNPTAAVDRGGAVQLLDADWCLDWWLAAADRWYTPASEAAVRQTRLGAGPLIQTAVRVPGGDILHRAWATPRSGAAAVVVEIENTTDTPVGLGLAVRPYRLDGTASSPTVTVHPDRVTIDDRVHVWLSNEWRDRLEDHRAVVVPLPHKTTARILISPQSAAGDPRTLPTVEVTRKAWQSLVASSCRVLLPDERFGRLFDEGRGRLSLNLHDLSSRIGELAAGAGDELTALALTGAETEATGAVQSLLTQRWFPPSLRRSESRAAAAAILDGLAWTVALYRPDWAEELLSPSIHLAEMVKHKRSDAPRRRAESALARLVTWTGRGEEAHSIEGSRGLGRIPLPGVPDDLAELGRLMAGASDTGSWGDDRVEPVAGALIGLRQLLVAERWSANHSPEVDLFCRWPSAWRGGAAELHALPTVFGQVSMAVRWHGYRPAILWDFTPKDPIRDPIRLRCSSLDPDWSSTELLGETLLAGTSEGLPAAPVEGESFT